VSAWRCRGTRTCSRRIFLVMNGVCLHGVLQGQQNRHPPRKAIPGDISSIDWQGRCQLWCTLGGPLRTIYVRPSRRRLHPHHHPLRQSPPRVSQRSDARAAPSRREGCTCTGSGDDAIGEGPQRRPHWRGHLHKCAQGVPSVCESAHSDGRRLGLAGEAMNDM
jgi:hypothetical protein